MVCLLRSLYMQERVLRSILITTHVNAEVFTTFSKFNNFTFNRRGVTFFSFPFLMVVLSLMHFFNRDTTLGVLFLIFAFLLPLGYLGFHSRSVSNQVKRFNLEKSRIAYTIRLQESGIQVSNQRENAEYPWDICYGAYRVKGYCYLYVTKAKCFILPDVDIEINASSDQVWQFLQEKLGTEKTKSYIKV